MFRAVEHSHMISIDGIYVDQRLKSYKDTWFSFRVCVYFLKENPIKLNENSRAPLNICPANVTRLCLAEIKYF